MLITSTFYLDESSHKAYRIEKGNNSLPTAKTARKKENKLKLFTLLKNDKEAFRPTDTDYYFENGLRKVRPYYHTFYTFTKSKLEHEHRSSFFFFV